MADDNLFIGYDHIAYATDNTDQAVRVLSALGFTLKIYKQSLDGFGVQVTKMVSCSDEIAEIVEPLGTSSVVSKILSDKGASVYHTCFRANDFYLAQERLKKSGAVTITKPMRIPYPVTREHVSFLTTHMYHAHLGLFEITGPVRRDGVLILDPNPNSRV